MAIATINPANGQKVREFFALSPQEIEVRLARAHRSALSWRNTPLDKRTRVVRRMGDLLIERQDMYGRLMTLEMGKPIKAAREEAIKCADACHYFADNAARFLASE